MTYNKPQRNNFDAVLWAENKTIKATQIQEGMIYLFTQGYEDFWGVENNTSKHTVEQMQQILDEMPAALDILTDAIKFQNFANNAFPGQLDEKYNTGVFDTSLDGNGKLTVIALNPAWIPASPEETPVVEE